MSRIALSSFAASCFPRAAAVAALALAALTPAVAAAHRDEPATRLAVAASDQPGAPPPAWRGFIRLSAARSFEPAAIDTPSCWMMGGGAAPELQVDGLYHRELRAVLRVQVEGVDVEPGTHGGVSEWVRAQGVVELRDEQGQVVAGATLDEDLSAVFTEVAPWACVEVTRRDADGRPESQRWACERVHVSAEALPITEAEQQRVAEAYAECEAAPKDCCGMFQCASGPVGPAGRLGAAGQLGLAAFAAAWLLGARRARARRSAC